MPPELTTHFSFLSLPRELRDEIYRHLVVSEPPCRPVSVTSNDLPDVFQRRNLSIFRTCRQIYEEAEKVFYSENIFTVEVRLQLYSGGGAPFSQLVVIEHSAPWEELQYAYVPRPKSSDTDISENFWGVYKPMSREYPVGIPFKPIKPPPSTLSIRCGQMIRHLDIHIKVAHVFLFPPTRHSMETYKNLIRSLAARLHLLVPQAMKAITIDTSYRLKDLLNMKVTVPFLTEGYNYLMEIASPLARGDYRVATDIDEELSNLVEEETVKKIQREALDSEVFSDNDELFSDIKMREGCHLATVQGRLIVQPDEAID
ncbi:hypothetical protein AA313_de0205553 [Arthrobotrys entomopaga]|nr:hypothetical protein AA313_de0205553 [Arthrobotrys entomopaga]